MGNILLDNEKLILNGTYYEEYDPDLIMLLDLVVTGGTIVQVGDIIYHIFLSSGNLQIDGLLYGSTYTLLGGGGGSCSGTDTRSGGGGGGGGLISGTTKTLTGSYSIVVGSGGSANTDGGDTMGTTTKYLCEGAKKYDGKVYGFDLFGAHGQWKQFGRISTKNNVEKYLDGFGIDNYKIYKVNSFHVEDMTNIIEKDIGVIDFVFIDGDHSYKGIKNDFDIVYPLLSPHGIIAFHDTLKIDGCREFIIDLRTKFNDGTFDVIDMPWGTDRREGISILVKRTYPILDMEIDESCGSPSDYDTIYKKEQDWYKKEIEKNK